MTSKKLYALGGAAVFVLVATFLVGTDAVMMVLDQTVTVLKAFTGVK